LNHYVPNVCLQLTGWHEQTFPTSQTLRNGKCEEFLESYDQHSCPPRRTKRPVGGREKPSRTW